MKRGDRKIAPLHFRPCAHVCWKRESVRAFLPDGSAASPIRRRSWGSAAPARTRRRRGRRCIRRSRSTHRRWLLVGRSCSSRNWGAVRAWRWTRHRMRQQSAVTSLASAMWPIRLQTSGRAGRPESITPACSTGPDQNPGCAVRHASAAVRLQAVADHCR